jgi:hypothetical protein
MTTRWDHGDTTHLKTFGLDGFAATGLGTFTAAYKVSDSGSETTYLGIFRLEKDAYYYEWKSGLTEKPLVTEGIYSLRRDTSPPPANP